VERAETNVKQAGTTLVSRVRVCCVCGLSGSATAGIIPAITGATQGPSVFLETGMTVRARTAQTPFDTAAASIIGATRQSTRYQRQLERQKYNEIYRVMDITLDDVCEQGMPNRFYGYVSAAQRRPARKALSILGVSAYPQCLAIYQMQSDIVDGLRYQYRPTDICFRVNMCGKKSYITLGIHSRYRAGGKKGKGKGKGKGGRFAR
jgi:hypothetical protein